MLGGGELGLLLGGCRRGRCRRTKDKEGQDHGHCGTHCISPCVRPRKLLVRRRRTARGRFVAQLASFAAGTFRAGVGYGNKSAGGRPVWADRSLLAFWQAA